MTGYMYILRCADDSYYTGSTKDLEKRIEEHQAGEGANHTRKRLSVKLVYFEQFDRIDDAFYREKQVQGWSRAKKEALINKMPEKLHDLARCLNETSHENYDAFGSAQAPDDDQLCSDRSLSGVETKGNGASAPLSHLVPQLRFPEFEGEWEEKRLKKIFNLFNGYAFKSNDSVLMGCRWVKIADVGINEIKEDNPSYLPNAFKIKHSKFLLKEDDIVVALTRPILGGKLKIARINKAYDNSLLNQRVAKLETKEEIEFVYQLLQQKRLICQIDNRIAGSDPPNLSPNEINGIIRCVPTIPEQQKIANFLTSVDSRISLLSKKKEKLEQYKKGIMQGIFSRDAMHRVSFKDENGNPYPKWEEKKLGEICNSIASGKTKPNNLGTYPLYGSTGIIGYCDNSSHVGDYILVARVGANAGALNIVRGEFGVTDNTLVVNINRDVILLFIYYTLRQFKLQRLIFGSGQPLITGGQLKSLKLMIPCIEEQKKIANFLSALDQKIEQVGVQIEKSQQFKKGLLQKMFV